MRESRGNVLPLSRWLHRSNGAAHTCLQQRRERAVLLKRPADCKSVQLLASISVQDFAAGDLQQQGRRGRLEPAPRALRQHCQRNRRIWTPRDAGFDSGWRAGVLNRQTESQGDAGQTRTGNCGSIGVGGEERIDHNLYYLFN